MTETLIIIRTKNEDRWIKPLIKSLEIQTYQNYKILVIDNNSKDRTIDILKEKKIEFLKIKKFLPGKAINMGINHYKKTKYIVCLSAHCLPEKKDWLKNLIKPLKNPKTIAVYGKQIPMFTTNSQDYRDLKLIFGQEKRIQKVDYFFHNANSAIKRKILKKYPFSEKATNMEDRIWSKNILSLKKGYQIVYQPKASVYHHHGLHHSNKEKRLNGVVKIMKSIEEDNLVPDVLKPEKQNIYAFVVGSTLVKDEKLFFKKNLKLIKDLKNNINIKKIIILVDAKLKKKINKTNSNKFIFINRNKKNKKQKIIDLIKMVYSKFKGFDIDYLMYFNLDYIIRPKNFISKLLTTLTKKNIEISTFAYEVDTNIWESRKGKYKSKSSQLGHDKDSKIFFNTLYGLGSLFFFNSLKKDTQEMKIEMLKLKNPLYLQRFSRAEYEN